MVLKCAICQTYVSPGEPTSICDACHGQYHRECWEENTGCATYGCVNMPAAIEKSDYPVQSGWAESAVSIGLESICERRVEDLGSTPNKTAPLIILICGLSGALAPFTFFIGSYWYLKNKDWLRNENPVLNVLAIFGLGISIFYCILIVLGIIVFSQ